MMFRQGLATTLPLFAVLSTTTDAASIRVCVQEREFGTNTNLQGAKVKCWDEDFADTDDSMTGDYYTGSDGCVTLSYSKKSPKWYNPCNGWDCAPYSNPDIYCKVTKGNTGDYYYPLYTNTKESHNQDNLANFGTVKIFPDRVARGDPGTTNGCGPASDWDGINNVADFLTGFEDQCNNHDLCYNQCGETQATCDTEFRDMMYSKCNDSHDSTSGQNACKAVALAMYQLVDSLGSTSYNNGQAAYGCR